jgi:predicted Zn-dependent protease with MMP-like domain
MDQVSFENIVEQTFERLPDQFKKAIENVGVLVEEYPDEEIVSKLRLRSKHDLLGLYQGIPLTRRGANYGTTPISPDKISLYKPNIEAHCRNDREVSEKIYEVLIHEIGHYFGMNEAEIRAAGF